MSGRPASGLRIALVVAGGVGREDPPRVVPHLVDRIGALAADHDVQVVALRQEPDTGRWSLRGATVWNVGRRPRRLRALATLARLHRARPLDVVHGFGIVPQGVVAAVAGRTLGVPVVLEAPGGEFVSFPGAGFGGWRRRTGRWWIRCAAGRGPVVVPSGPAADAARARGFDAVVVPLELDRTAWPERAPRPPPAPPWRMAWIGSLSAVKDPALLVEVLVALRERGLDVVVDVMGEDLGDGATAALAVRRGVPDRIAFHGLVDGTGVRDALDRAHLLLVTSLWESGPRTVLEAASRGVPTLGPSFGLLEAWSPEATVTVTERSAGSLADTAQALFMDEPRRARIAAAAARRLEDHDADRVAERWVERYRAAGAGR